MSFKNLIFTFLIFSFSSFAQFQWKIEDVGNFKMIKTESGKDMIQLYKNYGDDQKIIKTFDRDPYTIIIYHSGSAGTSVIMDVHYAIIYHKKKKEFLGQYPWEMINVETKEVIRSTKWNFVDDYIEIIDLDTYYKDLVGK